MTFEQMNLHQSIKSAIRQSGYENPTEIQANAIPYLLEGRDMLGSAQTGTGKTAAFALPIIHHVEKRMTSGRKRLPTALILAPTRELALQIKESFDTYSSKNQVKAIAIYGGVPKRNQIIKLKRGVDILIATPGRLLDLLEMKIVRLNAINHFVLDEADQMLDMGFIDDVNKIIAHLPENRQSMLFSATIPKPIVLLSQRILTNPVRVEVIADNTPLKTVEQSVCFVDKSSKINLLKDILKQDTTTSALVFVRTKSGCNRIVKQLLDNGIAADAIHGNKTQIQRQKALNKFKANETSVLVATDVAARGIDINALSHVINYDMPEKPETYLHRIGRTARAGKLGSALSFCSPEENHLLKAIQKHIDMRIAVDATHAYIQKNTQKTNQRSPQNRSGQPRHTKQKSVNFSTKKPNDTQRKKREKYTAETADSFRNTARKRTKNYGKKRRNFSPQGGY